MQRTSTYNFVILLLSMTFIFSAVALAEIYKWVDADGNVHFGDKPKDPLQARDAQQVELGESYQPSVRTAQEKEEYDNEQRLIILRDQMRRREESQAQDEAEVRRRTEKEALCARYEEAIKKLSTVVVKNGGRTRVYLEGEDGKSISSERQRKTIEELKAEMADAGCR
jgi:hypothetical protein